MQHHHSIYLLECKHAKFYVGRCLSQRISERYQEHLNGEGSAFTKCYKPIKLAWTRFSADPLDEDAAVLECMRTYGIDNVRGGTYCRLSLPQFQIDTLSSQLAHASGACFKCGVSDGHFSSDCSAVSPEKSGFPRNEAGAATQRIADNVQNTYWNFYRSQKGKASGDKCFRCGREGHWSSSCYARKHLDGSPLPPLSD